MTGVAANARKMGALEAKLREAALAYPETHEDFPWGDRVVKVKKKVFVFMGVKENGHFGCSLKLPHSGALVLDLPFAEPTGYGLGKSGWVSISTGGAESPDLGMLLEWLDESYRAVAPATIVKKLDAGEPTPKKAAAKKTAQKKTAQKKAAPKKAAPKREKTPSKRTAR